MLKALVNAMGAAKSATKAEPYPRRKFMTATQNPCFLCDSLVDTISANYVSKISSSASV
jgi:hypothetical protein